MQHLKFEGIELVDFNLLKPRRYGTPFIETAPLPVVADFIHSDLPLSFSPAKDSEGRTTKRGRFTEEHIIAVLREHEAGAKTGELARKHGISEATLYNWKAKYGAAWRYPKPSGWGRWKTRTAS